MRWQQLKNLPDHQFKRLTGVKKDTYELMVLEVKKSLPKSKHKVLGKKRGPKHKLTSYDKILMMLMYYREYRSFAHIAMNYHISESQCWRIITWIESVLIKSKMFHLPGKKKLLESDMQWEAVVIDVSEHSIERPKKNSADIIQGKRKNIA